jgi:hypothetical protein
MNELMTALLSALLVGALAAPAAAQAKPEPPAATKATKTTKAKTTKPTRTTRPRPAPQRVKEYDFTGDELEGDIQRPDGTDITGRRGATFTSLIKVRTHFLREIGKAAEDL